MNNKKINRVLLSLGIDASKYEETQWLTNKSSFESLKFEYKPSDSKEVLTISEEEFANIINEHKAQYGVLQYHFYKEDRVKGALCIFIADGSYTCKGSVSSILSKIPNIHIVGGYNFGGEECMIQRTVIEFYRDQTLLGNLRSVILNLTKRK